MEDEIWPSASKTAASTPEIDCEIETDLQADAGSPGILGGAGRAGQEPRKGAAPMTTNSHVSTHPTEIPIEIDGKPFKAVKPVMTGAEIKILGGVPANLSLFKRTHGNEPDEPIGDAEPVQLHPGDHFYALPPGRVGDRLPSVQQELVDLKEAYPQATVIDGAGGEFFVAMPIPLPEGRGWSGDGTEILVQFPATYPQARPANLFVRPGLARSNGAVGGHGGPTNIAGGQWCPLCWSPAHSEEARKSVVACVRFAISRFNEAQ